MRQVGENETIILKTEVNPALVGGLTVQIGDKFMDLSISSKIASVKVTPPVSAFPCPFPSVSVWYISRKYD